MWAIEIPAFGLTTARDGSTLPARNHSHVILREDSVNRKPLRGPDVVNVLVRLRPRLHRSLKARAVAEDRAMAAVIRDALTQYLERAW